MNMSFDPIDNSREDNKRIDIQRQNRSRDTAQKKGGQDFAGRYQAKIKEKEIVDSRQTEKDPAKQEVDLFSRVIQVFKSKEESKHQDSHDTTKKDEFKKEKTKEEKSKNTELSESDEGHSKTVSEDGHARVAAKNSSSDQGGGGGGQSSGENQSGSDHQSSHHSSGGQGGGFSDSRQTRDAGLKDKSSGVVSMTSVQFVKAMGKATDGGGEQSGRQPQLSPELVNELVEKVCVGLNEKHETEMEVQLTDDTFSGLKVKVTQTADGLVVTFVCSNRKVREQFLIQRPRIHQKLKDQNLDVLKIEITL